MPQLPPLEQLDPKTDGTVTLSIMSGETPLPDATVTANVFAPSGLLIAENIAVPYSGFSGDYTLAVLAAWSTTVDGEAIEGVFEVEASAERFGKIRTHYYNYLVKFV